MIRQILQQLLEHQSFISSSDISNLLKQPVSLIEHELKALDQECPGLLMLQYDAEQSKPGLSVRIAEQGEELARKLLG